MTPEPPLSVEPFLRALVDAAGSDLHCKVGSAPRIRIDGHLRRVQSRPLTQTTPRRWSGRSCARTSSSSSSVRTKLTSPTRSPTVDASASTPSERVERPGWCSAGSASAPSPLEALGLPEVVGSLTLEPRGLVLVTGPTGSGKTTTLAGMIDLINQEREVHIVTIEDPIEILHFDKQSMINQREVRVDTKDFVVALRAAMRQDPDVILVGEMRDAETVKAALLAAETGHFVMSTLHTTDAQETINRVIDFFPPHEQKQVRLALAGSLRGIICQRLVPRADGGGRCVAMEIAVNTGHIADAIADPDKTSTIAGLIAEGSYYGMQSFDQHLVALIRDGIITQQAAMMASTSPHDLSVELRRIGLVA